MELLHPEYNAEINVTAYFSVCLFLVKCVPIHVHLFVSWVPYFSGPSLPLKYDIICIFKKVDISQVCGGWDYFCYKIKLATPYKHCIRWRLMPTFKKGINAWRMTTVLLRTGKNISAWQLPIFN